MLRTAREALGRGPVLVQVPRRGYVTALGCARCRDRARCAACGGPLALAGVGAAPRCGWCGPADERLALPALRAFGASAPWSPGPGAPPRNWAGPSPGSRCSPPAAAAMIPAVPGSPALVVATPGAEPRADGGYAAALLLDGWMLLGRPSLRAAEEALRRWLNAAALVRPGPRAAGWSWWPTPAIPAVQALVRWDPVTHAERELAERAELRFPPAVRMASLTGPQDAVEGAARRGRSCRPAPSCSARSTSRRTAVRMLVRVPRSAGLMLAAALHAAQAGRSARKDPGAVRVQLDPAELI